MDTQQDQTLGVFSTIASQGSNFENMICADGSDSTCASGAVAYSLPNDQDNPEIHVCPSSLAIPIESTCDGPGLGLGAYFLHERSHSLKPDPDSGVADGPPSMNNGSCYDVECLQNSALAPTCQNTFIAQAYAFYAVDRWCAKSGNPGTSKRDEDGIAATLQGRQPSPNTPSDASDGSSSAVNRREAKSQPYSPMPELPPLNDEPTTNHRREAKSQPESPMPGSPPQRPADASALTVERRSL